MTPDTQHFQALLAAIPYGVQESDLSGRIVYSNQHHHKMLGYKPEELVGMSIFELIHDENEAPELKKYLAYLIKEQPEPTPYINKSRCKDGSPLATKIDWRYTYDKAGQLKGFISIITDITDQNLLQENLRHEHDLAHHYLDIARFMMLVLDSNGNISLVNRETCHITGYTYEQLIYKNWFQTCLPNELQTDISHLFKMMMDGKSEIIDYYESEIISATGDRRLIAWHNTFQHDANGKVCGTISSGVDITKQRQFETKTAKLQDELQRSQKLEAVGRLTAGIAHDFNNILASVLGYADLALDTISGRGDEELERYLTEVVNEGEKARDLIKQMLAFSRVDANSNAALPPLPLIKETVKFLETTAPKNIQIYIQADEDIPNLNIPPEQLHQLVLAITNNAIASISKTQEGHINIGLSRSEIRNIECTSCGAIITDNFLEINISDDGLGIKPETLNRLFSSTEMETELGTAQEILHQNNGHILIESIPDYGTTVHLLLPLADVKQRKQDKGRDDTNCLNIMIVDDDMSIAHLKGEFLEAQGYKVDTYSDSIKALENFQKRIKTYDCVLIKQDMPSLDGIKLSQELLQHRSDLPIILFAPETDNSRSTNLLKMGIKKVINKPVDSQQLTALISQLTNQKQ